MLTTAERRSFCTDSRALERRRDLCRIAHFLAIAAQHLGEFPERHITQEVLDVATLLAVFRQLALADLVHRGIVPSPHVCCSYTIYESFSVGQAAAETQSGESESLCAASGEHDAKGATP